MCCQHDIPVDAGLGAQAKVVVVRYLRCEVASIPLLGRKSLCSHSSGVDVLPRLLEGGAPACIIWNSVWEIHPLSCFSIPMNSWILLLCYDYCEMYLQWVLTPAHTSIASLDTETVPLLWTSPLAAPWQSAPAPPIDPSPWPLTVAICALCLILPFPECHITRLT